MKFGISASNILFQRDQSSGVAFQLPSEAAMELETGKPYCTCEILHTVLRIQVSEVKTNQITL